MSEKNAEYASCAEKLSSEMTRLQADTGAKLDHEKAENARLTELLNEREKSLAVVEKDREKIRSELETRLASVEDVKNANDREQKSALLVAQTKWEKERYELRRVYEKKIEALQKKVRQLREESTEVRKVIVGAAADLYNSYASTSSTSAPSSSSTTEVIEGRGPPVVLEGRPPLPTSTSTGGPPTGTLQPVDLQLLTTGGPPPPTFDNQGPYGGLPVPTNSHGPYGLPVPTNSHGPQGGLPVPTNSHGLVPQKQLAPQQQHPHVHDQCEYYEIHSSAGAGGLLSSQTSKTSTQMSKACTDPLSVSAAAVQPRWTSSASSSSSGARRAVDQRHLQSNNNFYRRQQVAGVHGQPLLHDPLFSNSAIAGIQMKNPMPSSSTTASSSPRGGYSASAGGNISVIPQKWKERVTNLPGGKKTSEDYRREFEQNNAEFEKRVQRITEGLVQNVCN
ncbi:unnamed protein product [Amoebophrya sp. A25]|nr:unnamed protein product [Amoebophrya sp. A25]|eukprot:GSA25T00006440001.1